MVNKIKLWFSNYLKKKKPLSIFFDVLFIILVILMLIPATRKELSSFIIRTTSMPASALDEDDQFTINSQTRTWKLYDYNGKVYEFDELTDKPEYYGL